MVPQRFFGAKEVRLHTFLFHTLLVFLIVIIMLNLHLCRYEGERSVEALAEFVNSEADVLVEFYAPWLVIMFNLYSPPKSFSPHCCNEFNSIDVPSVYRCGHCKHLAPVSR